MNQANASSISESVHSDASIPGKVVGGQKSKRLIIALAVLSVLSVSGMAAYSIWFRKDSQDYLAAAREMEEKGDAGSAVIEYKNALQANPANQEARFNLGKLYFARYKFEAAAKEFGVVLKSGNHPEALPLLARTMLLLGEHDRVLEKIQPISGGSPSINAEVHALRARAQMTLGDAAGFEDSMRLAEALQANHPASQLNKAMRLMQQGGADQALALVEQALGLTPRDSDLLLLKGDLLANFNRIPEAISAYNAVVESEPGNVRALMASANLYMQSNQLDQVAARIKAARAVAPDNLILRYQEAMLEFRHGRTAEALAKIQDVLKAAPDFLPGRLLAGVAALAVGRNEAAIKDLEYVLAQTPDNQSARKFLAIVKMQSGQGNEAKDLLSKLAPSLLDDPILLSAQGKLAMRNQDYAEARKRLQRAAELKPDQPELLTELAASQIASGDETSAIDSLEQAAILDLTGESPADLLLIQSHLKAKRYDLALKAIDRLERKKPQSPVPSNLRGAVAAAKGDQTQARAHFGRALKLQPGYLPAANNLAQLDVQAKDFKSARQRFEEVIQHDPQSVGAWLSLARLAAVQQDDKACLANLEKAKKIAPDSVITRETIIKYWLNKRDFGRVITESRDAIAATGNNVFYNALGIAYLQQGNKADALSVYAKWVQAAPTSPVAHLRLALAQESSGKRAEALSNLAKALKLAPDYPDAVLATAGLLASNGEIEQALQLARDFQKRHANDYVGYAAEALVQAQARHPAEAAKLFERAASLSGQGRFLVQAKAAYVAAGQAQTAEKILSDWLTKHPKDVPVRHALSQLQLDAGRSKEASAHYEWLIKANPNDLIALNNLALAYGNQGDSRALSMAERALKLQPENAAVLDTLGWLLVRSGQLQRGTQFLRQAAVAKPDAMEIRWHLASALAKSGDKNNAIAELDRLLASRIPFAQAAEARTLLQSLQTSR